MQRHNTSKQSAAVERYEQSMHYQTAVMRRKTESKTGKGDLLSDALHKRGRLPIFEMARYASGKPLAERSARLVRGNAFP